VLRVLGKAHRLIKPPFNIASGRFRRVICFGRRFGTKHPSASKRKNIWIKGGWSQIIGLVREKLADPSHATGFILDGFPRTVPQAETLANVLAERGLQLDRVINFKVPREEIVKRLSGRRSCPKCQATYHVEFAPSKSGRLCERCGETLVQRSDDQREAIEMRLRVYEEQTAPLINFYEKQRLLLDLNGAEAVETVYRNLVKALATPQTA
jgi:adenylate kinase